MINPVINQSISIIGALLFVFLVEMTPLSNYSSYLLAFLIIFSAIYISIKKRSKTASDLFTGGPVELFAITSVILLTLLLTGGLASPLFFFLYFLFFLLAFMTAPLIVWVLLTGLILYFLPQITNFEMQTLIKLGSLVLIAPIAYFVGRELERRQLLNREIDFITDEIIQEAEALKETAGNAGTDETEAIDEIIEEASSLKKDASS